MARGHASAVSGVLKRPFDQQVAFFRRKMGNLVPTERWDDIHRGAHDLGFMVAGATKADLLTDLAAAVERTITEGKSIQAFREDFRDIVERRGWHGWTGEGSIAGERWRTRVIYQTNLSTSYAAARYRQLEQGGYELWVYKHSGSREPRPEHLAWDGLTLPRDHPFWRTHGPKNGWGCECYVVGARDERAARRLGGDPDRGLPRGWDATDPRTGAPAGIDKGWDYRPGRRAEAARRISEALAPFDARLRDMALAAAEKISHWPYDLATAYMRGVPAAARDAAAVAYRALPSVATETRRYARRILEGLKGVDIPETRTLGLATAADARRIRAAGGPDVTGYDFAVDRSAVGKIRSDHGTAATERPRGQRPVTADDYARLPRLLNDYRAEDLRLSDELARGTSLPVVEIRRRFGAEEMVTLWEVRSGRRRHKSLTLKTMWVIERRG